MPIGGRKSEIENRRNLMQAHRVGAGGLLMCSGGRNRNGRVVMNRKCTSMIFVSGG